jgi:hypothetical protein
MLCLGVVNTSKSKRAENSLFRFLQNIFDNHRRIRSNVLMVEARKRRVIQEGIGRLCFEHMACNARVVMSIRLFSCRAISMIELPRKAKVVV